MEKPFEVTYINPGHWDIWSKGMRLYRIRGNTGDVKLWGDNKFRNKPERTFTNVQSCMAEICAEFMHEGV